MQEFLVKLEEFEGPLDLLLDLIEKRKMHINEISLSAVTDDFINYVKELEKYSIPHVAHFVLVASTLLLIKSKSLLPSMTLTDEEAGDIRDLEERLRALERIRQLSLGIKSQFGKNIIFAREERTSVTPIFSPDESVTKKGVFESILRVISEIPIKELIPKTVVQKVISLEEMIENLVKRVESSMRMSFKEFTKGNAQEKKLVIVSFLAMLELVKQGVIAVRQEKHFDDIDMEHSRIGVPRII